MNKEKKEKSEKISHAEAEKTKKLAERYNVPYIDLSSITISRELVQSFPVDFLYRSNFVPFEENEDTVKIAIADPSDIATIDAIESYLGRKVEVCAASTRAIHEALRKSETALQVLRDATEGFIVQVVDKEGVEEPLINNETEYKPKPRNVTLELISLTPQNINSEDGKESSSKGKYFYLFIGFCILLVVLLI